MFTILRIFGSLTAAAIITVVANRYSQSQSQSHTAEHTATSGQCRKKGKCLICNKDIETEHSVSAACKFGCLFHSVCFDLLKEEGQNVCPSCWQPITA